MRTAHRTVSTAEIYQEIVRPPEPTHALRLALAYFPDAGWSSDAVLDAARAAAVILGQCQIVFSAVDLHRLEGNARYHYYHTRLARELAVRVPLPRPTIYFVADTLQRPAFDAEAIGRGNSRTRPELAHTVWITRGARDLGIVLAHELAHVLMDSGEHVEEADNLMRPETAPKNTRLEAGQCKRLRAVAAGNGLLRPFEPPK